MSAIVSLSGVVLAYDQGGRRHHVFDGLDLDVPDGGSLALVGPSGSGKTSLLNLMTGLQVPERGAVRFQPPGAAPCELHAMDADARAVLRRHHVGCVFQFFNLLPTLTVRENVLLPLDLVGALGDHERVAAAEQRLAGLGLGERLDAFPDALSGGEQQRVAIARALAHGPQLVAADEPTGNLDRATAEQVADLLFDSVAASGATLVVATHSEALAARADAVLAVAGR